MRDLVSQPGEVIRSRPASRTAGHGPLPYPAAPLCARALQAIAQALTKVTRSWRDRFGVPLLDVGLQQQPVLVAATPTTIDHSVRVAAEHYARD